MKNIVSLSLGKDSTAMLLMMLEKGMQVDEIIYADTGMDFPEMEAHMERIRQSTGRDITILRSKHSFEYYMLERIIEKGEFAGHHGYGWPTVWARWCTGQLKTHLIDKHVRKYHEPVIQFVGIAADEAHRAKSKRYPLIEWGITERQALQYCYDRGFHWGGLYRIFRRVSCWCCPLQPLRELGALRKHFPALWAKLREMDVRAWNQFRPDYSVEQLEERFAREDMQMRFHFTDDGSYIAYR